MPRRPERGGLLSGLRFKRPRELATERVFLSQPGPSGAAGADGESAGLTYSFDSTTTMADPGTGDVRFNNATIGSVTQIAISDTDDHANDNDVFLDQWDDSTSSNRGQIVFLTADGQAIVFNITGNITDQGTWHQIPVTYVSGVLPTNDEALFVLFARTGDKGSAGRDQGLQYRYSNNTANSDPGSANYKFDSTTFGSITKLRISETDEDANGVGAFLATWDDSDSTVKGILLFRNWSAASPFSVFQITGTITDNGTWDEFTVTPISGSLPTNGDAVSILFIRTGDKGATGSTGATGPTGRECQYRLSLVSGDPCPSADQTAKSTLYAVPYGGNLIDLYSGGAWASYSPGEKSIALSGLTSGKNYDVWGYVSAGTLALELLVWTDDTNRATALALQDGVLVKSGDATRRYLGTIRTTGTTTTEDSAAKRFVWNYYNRVRKRLIRTDTTATWNYQTNSWRQARAQAANQVEAVIGVSEDTVGLRLSVGCAAGASSDCSVGIGVDSTTALHADSTATYWNNTAQGQQDAFLDHQPTAGYHFFTWLERTVTTTNQATFFGEATSTTVYRRSGLRGHVLA